MTTTELIALLSQLEFGASGRPREITICTRDEKGGWQPVMGKGDELFFISSGDGIAGAEIGLGIQRREKGSYWAFQDKKNIL